MRNSQFYKFGIKQDANFIMFLVVVITLLPAFARQKKELTWEELQEEYECPEWFSEAGFGIWVHWGAQTEPEQGGGWYARHMYMQDVGTQHWGKNAYPYHCETYGHPSEIGYKDVIQEWKAEHLNTDSLVHYFKDIGSKYFMALANHHDHFDNFNSTHHDWNSVNIGPKRDIIAAFSESSKKYGLPFGVSSHDDRFLKWWLPAFGADTSGPYKGIPYDGHMTREDGEGKWWEGLDPSELYGLPPEKRTPEWITHVKENWVLRHKELATKYDVDMLWFDGRGFPYEEYGKEVCAAFYNHKLQEDGKIDAVIAGKIEDEPAVIKDMERGVTMDIFPERWQSIITFTEWFYKKDEQSRHNAQTVIDMLIDANSKNGNLVLNVELLPDGTIPPNHKIILDEIGSWINLHSEAIYASKPWKIYGDNLDSYLVDPDNEEAGKAALDALKKESKNKLMEKTIHEPAYGHDQVRFTTKNDVLYVYVLNPKEGEINIPSLGMNSEYKSKMITSIEMLVNGEKIAYDQLDEMLTISIPSDRPSRYATVLKVKGIL